ncbi:MAG: alanine/glycine:cation symporter family protein [Bacteroidales bacterium]|nr:alanine/glycine:cation symporter family protein [Bacteroidales bacterium]
MESFFTHIGSWLATIIQTVNGWVWSPALVVLCLLSGLFFSLRTRFVQVRRFGEMFRLLFNNDKGQKTGISSFQAFAMALSGRVGTGNIVGVATAIGFGGPGAIVWMWIIAFFGAGSAFVEATLAQIFKEKHNGQFRGGPAYYIEKGLHSPFFASLFAIMAAIACGLFLPPVQCNGIALSMARTFNIEAWIVGLAVALLIALVVIGGVKRIANVAQIIAPFMAIIYIILAVVVLIVHYDVVPHVFIEMLRSAVGVGELGGAIIGSTIAWGVKRGIYSNEAGQGTGPIVAAAAKVDHPVKQGLVQAFSVYIDTLLVCTATALMILACGTYNIIENVQLLPGGGTEVTYLQQNPNAPLGEPGVFYTSGALSTVTGPRLGDIIISIALFFFAFTTIMAYYYYAETNLIYLFSRMRRRRLNKMKHRIDSERNDPTAYEHLVKDEQRMAEMEQTIDKHDAKFGDDRSEKIVVWTLRLLTVTTVFVGSIAGSGTAWTLGDIGVGSMAWINIIAILLLSPKAIRSLRDYERQQREGIKPHFDPQQLNIQGADFWEEQQKQSSQ